MSLCDLSLSSRAALVSGVSKCATVVMPCEGRIRQGPVLRTSRNEHAACIVSLAATTSPSYKSANLLISKLSILPKPVTIFSTGSWPHIWGQTGIWVFKEFEFTRLLDFQVYWVFTAFGQISLRFHGPAYASHPLFTSLAWLRFSDGFYSSNPMVILESHANKWCQHSTE